MTPHQNVPFWQSSDSNRVWSLLLKTQYRTGSRGVARISVRGVLKIFSAVRARMGVGGVRARTGSGGRCGALCSRFLLIPAIYGILLPAQRGVLEPPEPPPGYASGKIDYHFPFFSGAGVRCSDMRINLRK